MKKTKKSHFIPRFFVKRFCDKNGNIYIYDKNTKKTKKSGPSDRAFYRNWLYSYYQKNEEDDLINIHDNEMENHFGLVESNIPPILKKIDSNISLNADEEDLLRLFCFIQWARTPSAILNSNNNQATIYKKILLMSLEDLPENELRKYFGDDVIKEEIVKMLQSEMYEINFDKPCILAQQLSIELYKITGNIKLNYDIVKTDKILIFGENPVLIKLPMTYGVEILMPLSTHQILYIHSTNIENKVEKVIDALNRIQIDQTDKYVFFEEKPSNFEILLSLNSCLNFALPNIQSK